MQPALAYADTTATPTTQPTRRTSQELLRGWKWHPFSVTAPKKKTPQLLPKEIETCCRASD